MSTPLTEEQIRAELSQLPGWRYEDRCLKKVYQFASFKEALTFIVRVGLHAEEQKHHPMICNIHSQVELILYTHDAGDQVTERDIKLAHTIEDFAWV